MKLSLENNLQVASCIEIMSCPFIMGIHLKFGLPKNDSLCSRVKGLITWNPNQISPTSFPLSFSSRSLRLLQILSRPLLSKDQGYYSCSFKAYQDCQKLDSLKTLPRFTA